jgi:low temperature requirement protein LtrA
MRPRTAPRLHIPRIGVELREREAVKPLELFFDLVFVLGFTQCTALMSAQPTWEGLGRGMLVLAVLWWAWIAYAWLTSVIDPEEGAVRLVMFAAMAGLLVVALCVPEAFGDRGTTFAVAYAVVRAAHATLFFIASRDDVGMRRSVTGLAIGTAVSVGLLVGASFLDGAAQIALWCVAIGVDWIEPAMFGMAGWRLVPGHFAERHNLVIILALGESIVALGVGAEIDLDAAAIGTVVLGIALVSALWWIYFDIVALVTALRLTAAPEGRERNRLARDSYTYLHFPMVAGIVLAALGLEETLAHVDASLDGPHAAALLGGVALYLLAHVALRLRNARSVNVQRLAVALVLLALIPLAREVTALTTLAVVVALLWGMVAYETATYDERRYRLRHGLAVDVAGVGSEADVSGREGVATTDPTEGD